MKNMFSLGLNILIKNEKKKIKIIKIGEIIIRNR